MALWRSVISFKCGSLYSRRKHPLVPTVKTANSVPRYFSCSYEKSNVDASILSPYPSHCAYSSCIKYVVINTDCFLLLLALSRKRSVVSYPHPVNWPIFYCFWNKILRKREFFITLRTSKLLYELSEYLSLQLAAYWWNLYYILYVTISTLSKCRRYYTPRFPYFTGDIQYPWLKLNLWLYVSHSGKQPLYHSDFTNLNSPSLFTMLHLSLSEGNARTHTPTARLALLATFDFKVAGSIVDHYACANDAAVLLLTWSLLWTV
jgi:hypothetical protein